MTSSVNACPIKLYRHLCVCGEFQKQARFRRYLVSSFLTTPLFSRVSSLLNGRSVPFCPNSTSFPFCLEKLDCVQHKIFRDVYVAIHGGFNTRVTKQFLKSLWRHAIFDSTGCISMPLRYNYDKPEKPRISRVFGYLARFFILFQTEKSSREVVIS